MKYQYFSHLTATSPQRIFASISVSPKPKFLSLDAPIVSASRGNGRQTNAQGAWAKPQDLDASGLAAQVVEGAAATVAMDGGAAVAAAASALEPDAAASPSPAGTKASGRKG